MSSAARLQSSEQLSSEQLLESLGPLYLRLHRENYLDEVSPLDVRSELASFVMRVCLADERFFLVLLDSQNWREVLVGVHCAITVRAALPGKLLPSLIDRMHGLLLDWHGRGKSLPALIARPVCLALTVLNRASTLDAFLKLRPIQADALDVYAAALSGLQQLQGLSDNDLKKSYFDVLNALHHEPGFDALQFQKSMARFAQAVDFWTASEIAVNSSLKINKPWARFGRLLKRWFHHQ